MFFKLICLETAEPDSFMGVHLAFYKAAKTRMSQDFCSRYPGKHINQTGMIDMAVGDDNPLNIFRINLVLGEDV